MAAHEQVKVTGPLHLVFVDDEEDFKEIIEFNFEPEVSTGKYKITFARSAKDCLDVLSSPEGQTVALVVSDVNMPGMNGIELVSVLGREYPKIKTFLCSAYDTVEHRQLGKLKGALEYIEKPIRFDQLRNLIAKYFLNSSAGG